MAANASPVIHERLKLGPEDISLIQEALSRIFECERLDFKLLLSDAFNGREVGIVAESLKPHPCFMYPLKKWQGRISNHGR